ncbi:MAG: ATP-binding protein, partial [Chloroflexi bacterium]|nr:ATP-binding protein [Chloroflexota bacterium]
VSFEALATVLKGNDLSLTRPYRGPANPIDFVQLAREEGESIVQAFHTSMVQRGGHQNKVLQDICAMANSNGGTIYIGVSANPKEQPAGVRDHKRAIDRLQTAIGNRITPEPDFHIDNLLSQSKQIVRVTVQSGQDTPYAIDDNTFFVRDDTETSLAVRDEIVRLVERNLGQADVAHATPSVPVPLPTTTQAQAQPKAKAKSGTAVKPPRTGVEIVASEKRKGTYYHTVRDLRNGNLIKNVTRSSARKLWHYAILKAEDGTPKPAEISWQGNIALIQTRKKNDSVWYDLALRQGKTVHFFYGVTDSGLNDAWLPLIQKAN